MIAGRQVVPLQLAALSLFVVTGLLVSDSLPRRAPSSAGSANSPGSPPVPVSRAVSSPDGEPRSVVSAATRQPVRTPAKAMLAEFPEATQLVFQGDTAGVGAKLCGAQSPFLCGVDCRGCPSCCGGCARSPACR